VSGPARRGASDRNRSSADGGLAVALIAALSGVSEHRLLDRLIRGRVWIALVAFALIGIVTMQLGLLKLNGDIGRALEREALVQRENAVLSIENSELSASDGVESRAARIGMEFVPVGSLRFLSAHRGLDAAGIAAALRPGARSSGVSSGEAHSGSAAVGTNAEASASTESPSSAGSSTTASATQSASPSLGASTSSAPSSGESHGAASTEPNAASGESAPASAGASGPAATTPAPPGASSAGAGAGTVVAAGGTQATPAGG